MFLLKQNTYVLVCQRHSLQLKLVNSLSLLCVRFQDGTEMLERKIMLDILDTSFKNYLLSLIRHKILVVEKRIYRLQVSKLLLHRLCDSLAVPLKTEKCIQWARRTPLLFNMFTVNSTRFFGQIHLLQLLISISPRKFTVSGIWTGLRSDNYGDHGHGLFLGLCLHGICLIRPFQVRNSSLNTRPQRSKVSTVIRS